VGRLFLPGDGGDLNVLETRLFEPPGEIAFTEAQPTVAIKLAHLFEAVLSEIKDENLTSGPNNPMGGSKGALWILGMMKRLTQNDEVNGLRFDRGFLEVSMAEFKVLKTRLAGFGGSKGDDFRGVVDGDHLAASQREQLAQQAFARSEVRHGKRRDDSKQKLPKCLPRTAWPVTTIESAGNLTEKRPRLVFPKCEHASQIDQIGFVLGKFAGCTESKLEGFLLVGLRRLGNAVIGPLSLTSGTDKSGLVKQSQVGRDTRLDQGRDELEFVDGEFSTFQQRENADAGGIGQSSKAP